MPYVTRHTALPFYFSLFHSDAVFSVAVAVLPLIKKVIILEEREALGRGRVFILSVFADRAGARGATSDFCGSRTRTLENRKDCTRNNCDIILGKERLINEILLDETITQPMRSFGSIYSGFRSFFGLSDVLLRFYYLEAVRNVSYR